jgi:hypothetical protein
MQFNDSELQILKLALSIARKSSLAKKGDSEEKGKSFFSWRASPTKTKMQELEEKIESHLKHG